MQTANDSLASVPHICAARLDGAGESVHVSWNDTTVSRYHATWLRDNCPCSSCRDVQTGELVLDHLTVPSTTRVIEASLAHGALNLTWSDHHSSAFDAAWLRTHAPAPSPEHQLRKQPTFWSAHLDLPTFDYASYMRSDAVLTEVLIALQRIGVCLLESVPVRDREVLEATRRISFVHRTNFGEFFDIETKQNPDSSAHTSRGLQLHTDLPHHSQPPQYQFFHCLINSAEGGRVQLLDGFHLVERMKRSAPESVHLLSSQPAAFRYFDAHADHYHEGCVLSLDGRGDPIAVRYAPNVVAPSVVPYDIYPRWRAAYLTFAAMANDPPYVYTRRARPGDLLITDNWRVLHGRTPYLGSRHFQGCYLEGAELDSRLRVLRRAGARTPGMAQ